MSDRTIVNWTSHRVVHPEDVGPTTGLTADALPNVPACIILSRTNTTVICAKCGEPETPGHMPTQAHGFRCAHCCEFCNPPAPEEPEQEDRPA